MINNFFETALRESGALKQAMASDAAFLAKLDLATEQLRKVSRGGGTIYVCGNGGSACDSMHFVEELVAKFKRNRPGIRAMHFVDSSTLTCWSNDFDFSGVFERYAQTFCTKLDALVAISTSGNSANVLKAVAAAKQQGSFTLGLTGRGGGKLAPACELALIVPHDSTERIQEVHITLIHCLCEALETQ